VGGESAGGTDAGRKRGRKKRWTSVAAQAKAKSVEVDIEGTSETGGAASGSRRESKRSGDELRIEGGGVVYDVCQGVHHIRVGKEGRGTSHTGTGGRVG